jgi:hypothetical protein
MIDSPPLLSLPIGQPSSLAALPVASSIHPLISNYLQSW